MDTPNEREPLPTDPATLIRRRFAPLGGVELELPLRQPMPEPPQFDPAEDGELTLADIEADIGKGPAADLSDCTFHATTEDFIAALDAVDESAS